MKRLFSLLLCLTLLVTPALAVVDKPANGYVGDYAGVLSGDLEEHIIARNETLFQSTGAEIVVAAVDFMDGLDAESYAKACFDEWGIGDAERNNGVLLVFAVGENRAWTMVGTGLENALSVSTLNGWMEDYFYDPYDSGDYDTAVRDFFDAAYDWLDSYYAGTGPQAAAPDAVISQTAAPDRRSAGTGLLLIRFIAFTVGLVILLVVVGVIVSAFSRPRYGSAYYDGGYFPWLFFWRRRRRNGPPPPPRPPNYRPHTGGGFHSGGVSRGGGAGRQGGGSGGFRSSGGSSFRSGGGSFRSGGHSRGGGAGRR